MLKGKNLIYSNARSMNEMVDVGVQLMKAGVDMIIVDSISAMLPAIYFEKDSEELKQLENTKQIGAEAKDMTNAVKKFYDNGNNNLTLDELLNDMVKLYLVENSILNLQKECTLFTKQFDDDTLCFEEVSRSLKL